MNLVEILSNPVNGYTALAAENKARFHGEGRRVLRQLARELGLEKSEFDLRSNKGGAAVSGEVTLHTDRYYVQLSVSCCAGLGPVMYRLCDGQADYTGKQNHFADVDVLYEPNEFANRLRRLTS